LTSFFHYQYNSNKYELNFGFLHTSLLSSQIRNQQHTGMIQLLDRIQFPIKSRPESSKRRFKVKGLGWQVAFVFRLGIP